MGENLSYDVKIRQIRTYEGKRGTTYTVRWVVAGQTFPRTFATFALADAFRSQLVSAAGQGKAFDKETGLPVTMRTPEQAMTWYDFAVEYADHRWAGLAANGRKNLARTLTAITLATLRTTPRHDEAELRTALREFGFNKIRRDAATDQTAAMLRWVQRNSRPMTLWQDAAEVDAVLLAVNRKLDGTPVAASSVARTRRLLNPLMDYAMSKRVLAVNPLPKVRKGAKTKSNAAVDKRSLISQRHTAALLGSIYNRTRGGKRLHAYFSTLRYCGTRPEETIALRVFDAHLPEEGWGELTVHRTTPEVGKQWTDTGKVHDDRPLKGRETGDSRTVPIHPALVAILRAHVNQERLRPGELLFKGEFGGVLSGVVTRRAWDTARKAVLTPEEYKSPLGKRVYDLRHTCLTEWLNEGIPPAQVAEWAGNSVAVLLSTYAKVIDGHRAELLARLGGAIQVAPPHGASDTEA